MGCYSSVTINPTGDEKDKMYTDRIHLIITKDGSKYEFHTPPIICNVSSVGVEKKSPVSIPLSAVSKTYAEGKSQFVVTLDSMKYQFDTPPTISNGSFVGEATNKPVSIPLSVMVIGKSGGKEVAIALSDVDKVQVYEFDTGRTIIAVVGALLGVGAVGLTLLAIEVRNGKL